MERPEESAHLEELDSACPAQFYSRRACRRICTRTASAESGLVETPRQGLSPRCIRCPVYEDQPQEETVWGSERYTAPFRVLMVDLVGPLEPQGEGNRYILTAMDVFSLWSWLVPLESKDPKEVAGALYRYVYLDLSGFPLILRSDNGSEFVPDVTRELNRLIGTAQVFGSAYHPRSQALVEGSHKPLEEVLQAYVEEYPTGRCSCPWPDGHGIRRPRSRCRGSVHTR